MFDANLLNFKSIASGTQFAQGISAREFGKAGGGQFNATSRPKYRRRDTVQIDHHLLVRLWDKAVGTPDYDKKQWSKLSNQVIEANHQLREQETRVEKERKAGQFLKGLRRPRSSNAEGAE